MFNRLKGSVSTVVENNVVADVVLNRPGFHAPSGFCEPAGRPVTS